MLVIYLTCLISGALSNYSVSSNMKEIRKPESLIPYDILTMTMVIFGILGTISEIIKLF